MPGYCPATDPTACRRWLAASTKPKTSRTSCSASSGSCSRGCCCRWATTASRKSAAWPSRSASTWPQKRDSQEICFVPSSDHAEFIRQRRGPSATAGEIVTSDGQVVGTHDGLERFTIGQRKGLGIALGEPRFVVRLEPETHRVVLGTKEELDRQSLTASRTNWLVAPPDSPRACTVKIRYNAPPVPATVTALPERSPAGRVRRSRKGPWRPARPWFATTAQQVLGGGWID